MWEKEMYNFQVISLNRGPPSTFPSLFGVGHEVKLVNSSWAMGWKPCGQEEIGFGLIVALNTPRTWGIAYKRLGMAGT